MESCNRKQRNNVDANWSIIGHGHSSPSALLLYRRQGPNGRKRKGKTKSEILGVNCSELFKVAHMSPRIQPKTEVSVSRQSVVSYQLCWEGDTTPREKGGCLTGFSLLLRDCRISQAKKEKKNEKLERFGREWTAICLSREGKKKYEKRREGWEVSTDIGKKKTPLCRFLFCGRQNKSKRDENERNEGKRRKTMTIVKRGNDSGEK